jgi:hypothetical protein
MGLVQGLPRREISIAELDHDKGWHAGAMSVKICWRYARACSLPGTI